MVLNLKLLASKSYKKNTLKEKIILSLLFLKNNIISLFFLLSLSLSLCVLFYSLPLFFFPDLNYLKKKNEHRERAAANSMPVRWWLRIERAMVV